MNSCTACHSCGCHSEGRFCASKVPIFSMLADEQLAVITGLITRRRYKKGQVLFSKGMYQISSTSLITGKLRPLSIPGRVRNKSSIFLLKAILLVT